MPRSAAIRSVWLLAFQLALAVGPALRGAAQATNDPATEAACRRQLLLIHDALQACRRVTGEYPAALSDLHPRFLADLRLLSCPAAQASRNFQFGVKEFRNVLARDPSTSYNYELSPATNWTNQATGRLLTYREFKLLQRATPVGDQAPIVRCCTDHGAGGCLNLSFAGQVYRSPDFWEIRFRHLLPHPYLTPESVMRDTRPIPQRLPARPAGLPPELVDLAPFCNGCLKDVWLWGKTTGPLRSLVDTGAPGSVSIGPDQFDVRGVIQLDGAPAPPGTAGFPVPMFPERVDGIPIRRPVRGLSLLLGTAFAAPPQSPIGWVRIEFQRGPEVTIPIVYGVDVEDSFPAGARLDSGQPTAVIPAWRSPDGAGRLYLKKWQNPRPDDRVGSLALVSAMTVAAPFFVALTLQP